MPDLLPTLEGRRADGVSSPCTDGTDHQIKTTALSAGTDHGEQSPEHWLHILYTTPAGLPPCGLTDLRVIGVGISLQPFTPPTHWTLLSCLLTSTPMGKARRQWQQSACLAGRSFEKPP